jgi:glycosyltransferase involved in cell wall biosynthesis
VDRFGGCDTPTIGDRLATSGFDACIVSGWYLKSYLQAIRACRTLRTPVLMRGDSHLMGPKRRLVAIAKRVPYRWFLQQIDAHLYVGEANRAYLTHYGVRPDRLFFAPHFVDNDRFAADAALARQSGETRRLRESWGARDATTVFMFVGKLIALKRVADFIEAVAALSAEGLDVRGVVVGSGPEEAALRERAAGRGAPVAFDGFQNQTAIAARYAAANCLVVPSSRETWGLVVNEAMAASVPAIVSEAVGCAPDLIDDGATGFTYPAGDVAQLIDRMRDVAVQQFDRRPDTQRAVLARVARYSSRAAVSGTMAALEAVCGRAPSPVRGRTTVHHA